MPDAVEHDPVGVGQPVAPEARPPAAASAGPGPPSPTRCARGSRSARRPAASPRAARASMRSVVAAQAAAPRSWWASSSAGRCSQSLGGVPRRAPAPLRRRHDRLRVRRGAAHELAHRREVVQRGAEGPRRPAPSPRPAPARRRVSARPRAASCSATCPPSELPTRCAVAKPAASIARSTASARVAPVSSPATAGPPACPASVGARTSCRRSSAGSTSSHVRHVSVKPCRQTIGGPAPPRWAGVNVAGRRRTLAGARGGTAAGARAWSVVAVLRRGRELAEEPVRLAGGPGREQQRLRRADHPVAELQRPQPVDLRAAGRARSRSAPRNLPLTGS